MQVHVAASSITVYRNRVIILSAYTYTINFCPCRNQDYKYYLYTYIIYLYVYKKYRYKTTLYFNIFVCAEGRVNKWRFVVFAAYN